MIQNIRMVFFGILFQPGKTLTFLSAATLTLSVAAHSADGCLAAALLGAVVIVWQKSKSRSVGVNFAIMPTMPLLDGKPYLFLYQKKRTGAKKVSCREHLRSLICDKYALDAALPAGEYKTITHDSALRVLRECKSIQMIGEPVPLYRKSLRSILQAQTGGRCKRCKTPCTPFRSVPRNFYLVHFEVA